MTREYRISEVTDGNGKQTYHVQYLDTFLWMTHWVNDGVGVMNTFLTPQDAQYHIQSLHKEITAHYYPTEWERVPTQENTQ